MSTEEIRVSDLSGQRIENPTEQRVQIVVTDHPNLTADQRAELDAMPDELANLGKVSIAAVGMQITFPGEEEPQRHIVTKSNFDKLFANGRAPDEIVAAAAVAEVVKQRAATGDRRSHNRTASGDPLINYSDPQFAGLPHNGKIGKREQDYVRANLDEVNARRTAAGHPIIDPSNAVDAERYGFGAPSEQPAQDETPPAQDA